MNAHSQNVSSENQLSFVNHAGRVRFWLLCGCTFLIFLSNSATTLFAKVLESAGYDESAVGTILAIYGISTISGIVASGFVAARIGVLQTVKLGAVLLLISYLSFAWTLPNFYALLISRLTQGFAYGLFLAPSMLFAKAQLSKRYFITLFGVFSGMVPLPNAIGPPVSAWLLDRFGMELFFFVTAPPLIFGVLGILLMQSNILGNIRTSKSSYTQLILRKDTRWIYAAIGFVGLLFGLIPSYMATYLIENNMSVGAFFSTFAIVMFGARFFVAPFIEKLRNEFVISAGVLAMGIAYTVIGYVPINPLVIFAGILFGLGYSLCYPRLSIMAITPFADSDREKPIALFNVFFVAGTYLTPFVIGTFKYAKIISTFLMTVGIIAIVFGICFFIKAAFTPKPPYNPSS